MALQATPNTNLLIEINTYVIAVVVLIRAWRQPLYFMFVMPTAMLFAFFVEYSAATSKPPAPRHSSEKLIALSDDDWLAWLSALFFSSSQKYK